MRVLRECAVRGGGEARDLDKILARWDSEQYLPSLELYTHAMWVIAAWIDTGKARSVDADAAVWVARGAGLVPSVSFARAYLHALLSAVRRPPSDGTRQEEKEERARGGIDGQRRGGSELRKAIRIIRGLERGGLVVEEGLYRTLLVLAEEVARGGERFPGEVDAVLASMHTAGVAVTEAIYRRWRKVAGAWAADSTGAMDHTARAMQGSSRTMQDSSRAKQDTTRAMQDSSRTTPSEADRSRAGGFVGREEEAREERKRMDGKRSERREIKASAGSSGGRMGWMLPDEARKEEGEEARKRREEEERRDEELRRLQRLHSKGEIDHWAFHREKRKVLLGGKTAAVSDHNVMNVRRDSIDNRRKPKPKAYVTDHGPVRLAQDMQPGSELNVELLPPDDDQDEDDDDDGQGQHRQVGGSGRQRTGQAGPSRLGRWFGHRGHEDDDVWDHADLEVAQDDEPTL